MKTLQNTINFAFNIMGMGSPATNGFLNYFNRRTEEFLRRVRNVKNTLDDENIHQLRVEVKKIRSVLKLLDDIAEDGINIKEYRKMLSRLFKPAGKLRETNINLGLLDQHTDFSLTTYRQYLQGKTDKQILKFLLALKRFDDNLFAEYNKKILEQTGLYETAKMLAHADQYIRKELDRVNWLKPEINRKKKLHHIRKRLKTLGYILNITLEVQNDENREGFYLLVKDTETLIGDWHDLAMFRNSLKKFIAQHPGYSGEGEMNRLISAINREITEQISLIAINLDRLTDNIVTI